MKVFGTSDSNSPGNKGKLTAHVVPLEQPSGPPQVGIEGVHRNIPVLQPINFIKPEVRELVFRTIREIEPKLKSLATGEEVSVFLFRELGNNWELALEPDTLEIGTRQNPIEDFYRNVLQGHLSYEIIADEETLYNTSVVKLSVNVDFGGNGNVEQVARDLFIDSLEKKFKIKVKLAPAVIYVPEI